MICATCHLPRQSTYKDCLECRRAIKYRERAQVEKPLGKYVMEFVLGYLEGKWIV
jgi:hypothetical protein